MYEVNYANCMMQVFPDGVDEIYVMSLEFLKFKNSLSQDLATGANN